MAVLAVAANNIVSRWRAKSAPFQPDFHGHIPELDALRALGLTLVLIDHCWPEGLSYLVFQLGNAGWVAMDSFFVMSGVLITGILLDSRGKPGYYSNYYARRSLRIFPLYYLVLMVWWLIGHLTNHGLYYESLVIDWGSPSWFIFYIGNLQGIFFRPFAPALLTNPLTLGYAPLWSLQIEEQFYILFPLLVAFMRRDHLRRLLMAAVFASPLLRLAIYLVHPSATIQYGELPTHCDGLALGALIAIRLRSGPWNISKPLLTLSTVILLGAAVAGSVLSTWGTHTQAWSSAWDRVPGYSISSVGCACLVLWLICFRDTRYTRWMRTAPLQYLGKISYGIYLLNGMAIWTLFEMIKKNLIHFHKDDPLYFVAAVALSLAYAVISWHFLEKPLLKLKKRFPYNRAHSAALEQSG